MKAVKIQCVYYIREVSQLKKYFKRKCLPPTCLPKTFYYFMIIEAHKMLFIAKYEDGIIGKL